MEVDIIVAQLIFEVINGLIYIAIPFPQNCVYFNFFLGGFAFYILYTAIDIYIQPEDPQSIPPFSFFNKVNYAQ